MNGQGEDSEPKAGSMPLSATPTAGLRRFKIDLERLAIEIPAIQSGDCGTCLVPLHLDKTKTLALTGKDVHDQFARAYRAKF